MFKKNNMKHFI